MSGLAQAAAKALTALFEVMAGTASSQRAELALTLHMLEGLAPQFFAEHRLARPLKAALAALNKVPARFDPKIGADEAMARLDALYLRKVRGLKPRTFDPGSIRAAVAWTGEENGALWGWLMGELAAPLGVDARVRLAERWPFRREEDPAVHLYHLTHLVLIQTEYLRRRVPEALIDELVELQAALPALIAKGSLDLLGECAFCLSRAGTAVPQAIEALRAAQKSDGRLAEEGMSSRELAHCTAVGVLALAGALDLERPDP